MVPELLYPPHRFFFYLRQNFCLLPTASSWLSLSAFHHPKAERMEQGREAMASRGFIWGLRVPGKEGWGDVLGGYVYVWEY